MKNLFRFMKKAGPVVFGIFALLCLQAYCDLALPAYTSNILNVGLQQNGIEDPVPETLRQEALEDLSLFMTDEDAKVLEDAYTEAGEDGIRTLKEEADREALGDLLALPESVLYQLQMMENSDMSATPGDEQREEQKNGLTDGQDDAQGSAQSGAQSSAQSGAQGIFASLPEGVSVSEALDMLRVAVQMGLVSKEEMLSGIEEQFTALTGGNDSYLRQVAVSYVAYEYGEQGIDVAKIQNAYLMRIGGRMLLMAFFMTAASILSGLLSARASAKVGRDLREQVYGKVMRFTSAEMENFSTASLITRCTNDIQQIQMVTVMLLRMVAYAPILAVFGIIRVVQTRSGMSWIIVLAVVLLSVCIGILMGIALPKFKIMQKLVDRLNLVSRELLTGVMPIRAFHRENYEEDRFEKANRELMETMLFTNRTMNFMMPVMMFIMNGVSVLIVWIGAQKVDMGTIQVGDLTAFITYSMVIIMGFLMMSMISVILPRAGVAADRIAEVLSTDVSLMDPAEPKDEALAKAGSELRFEDVSFSYPGAPNHALENISFTAEPGKTTAIIGSTGCGKTTLLNLIPRFFDVTEGRITLGGIDIREVSQKALRSQIGYVPQKGMLFSGTIESNLKFGGDDITDEAMMEAARIAQATEFIESKENKYQASIAQDGSNVSGGQRQRLSIARAIARNPKIYLFDDSFSALDYKTDLALRKELAKHTEDAAVIIVAQRISTILHADQILCMEDGRIVGCGTHEELMATCGTYREIAKSQLSEEELAANGVKIEKGGEN